MAVDTTQSVNAVNWEEAGAWRVWSSPVLDLSGITTTATIQAIAIPAGSLVFGCVWKPSVACDGTSPVAEVGDDANTDGYIDNIALDTTTWATSMKTAGAADEDYGIEGGASGKLYTTANTIDMVVSLTGTTTTGAGRLYAYGLKIY